MFPVIFVLSGLAICAGLKSIGFHHNQPFEEMRDAFVNITGDFIIGAMFPIHNLVGGGKCGYDINDQDGIQNLEALLFSLDIVNENILREIGVKLGVIAMDSCYSDTVALERALMFVKLRQDGTELNTRTWVCGDGSVPQFVSSGKLIGVVGAATSGVSIQLASFLRLFKLPQISYASTSPELSDAKRYDYFMRTVPSDIHQAHAIVEILRKLEWTYVVGIYEDTSYGMLGFGEVKKQAEILGICIAEEFKVKRYFKTEEDKVRELEEVVDQLDQFNNTEGNIIVILYTSLDIANSLFETIKRVDSDPEKFVWVGSDAWSGRAVKESLQSVAEDSLTVQPEIRRIPAFDSYFKSLKPVSHVGNPWFKEYWEQLFHCTFNEQLFLRHRDKVELCTGNETMDETTGTYRPNLNTYATMDAVYVFAHALYAIHRDRCQGRSGVCAELENVTGQELMGYMKNVTFTDPAGRYFEFFGTDGPASYSIVKYTSTADGYTWQQVGVFQDFQNTSDHFNMSDAAALSTYRPSMCSAPCQKGEAKSKKNNCCWSCSPCAFYQYLKISDELCIDCPSGELPNNTMTGCEPIPEVAMSYGNIWAIISVLIASVGMVVTILVGVVFYKYKDTPVIMAAGKELSYVLLIGIFFSYLSTFLFVGYPSGFTCGASRLLLGLCYTLCYAAILVKTNRIYRVFNINTKTPKRVRLTSRKSQLLIVFGIVMVEVAALVAWLVFDPPESTHVYPTKSENIHVCADSTDFSYLGALVYPFLLMVLCIVYAVMTRKTPDGFNETRFIAFGSYSFCITWIAFIPIYFAVSDNTVRIVALCLASSVNATVTLITLFLTKVYIAILKPEKNTKENVMSRNRRRTQSYETVDLNNLSNLSKIASAVSSWSSAYDSGNSPSPMRSKFGNQLSVAVVSMNNISDHSHGTSPYQRPKLRRRATVGDVIDTDGLDTDVISTRTDFTEISLNKTDQSELTVTQNKTDKSESVFTQNITDQSESTFTQNKNDQSEPIPSLNKTEKIEPNFSQKRNDQNEIKVQTIQNGISPKMSQRRTLKAKRKTFTNRPKSADPYVVPDQYVVPDIVVTNSKSEDVINVRL